MRKFFDTFGLVISSFVGVLLFIRGYYLLFTLAIACQYVSFLSYATRIRNLPLKSPPLIFSIGYTVVMITYLICCIVYRHLILT